MDFSKIDGKSLKVRKIVEKCSIFKKRLSKFGPLLRNNDKHYELKYYKVSYNSEWLAFEVWSEKEESEKVAFCYINHRISDTCHF